MEQKDSDKHPGLRDSKLSWEPTAGIRVPPLFIPSAENESRQPISRGKLENKWTVLQSFHAGQNRALLTALENGLEAVELPTDEAEFDFTDFLDGVYPNMVEIHFSSTLSKQLKGETVVNFLNWLKKGNWNPADCKGSFRFKADEESERNFHQYSGQFPEFTWFFFESDIDLPQNNKVGQLVSVFTDFLRFLDDVDVLKDSDLLKKSTFRLYAGNDFIAEVAKIRAFYLIWNLVISRLGCGEISPDLEISILPESYEDNTFNNLIRTTSIFTSGVIAGAGRIHIPSFIGTFTGQFSDPIGFIRRMNVNISHILRHESHFEKVVDPASGSYTIEALSEKFARTAWSRIRENV